MYAAQLNWTVADLNCSAQLKWVLFSLAELNCIQISWNELNSIQLIWVVQLNWNSGICINLLANHSIPIIQSNPQLIKTLSIYSSKELPIGPISTIKWKKIVIKCESIKKFISCSITKIIYGYIFYYKKKYIIIWRKCWAF